MPTVSVTRLRLRSILRVPVFLLDAHRSLRQAERSEGFLAGSLLADRHRAYWTMTLWRDDAAMRDFVMGGAHRRSMPKLLDWCDEASVVHWSQDDVALPAWSEADRRMRAEGRASRLRHPAPAHADLSYAPPRLTATTRIRARPASRPDPVR